MILIISFVKRVTLDIKKKSQPALLNRLACENNTYRAVGKLNTFPSAPLIYPPFLVTAASGLKVADSVGPNLRDNIRCDRYLSWYCEVAFGCGVPHQLTPDEAHAPG